MAITTLTGALAGMQPMWPFVKNAQAGGIQAGKPYSYWGQGGFPGAGSVNTTLNGGTYSSSGGLVSGQIPHFDPVAGNSYLSRFQAQAAVNAGVILLCDRLWDNGGITITSTSLQAIASPTWPARDNNGATAGAGILIGVEISAATGAGTPTITVGYTNSSGAASRTATNIDSTLASSIASSFYRVGVQAGDTGVQSVQSVTLSATWTSGTMNLVAYRVFAQLECPVSSMSASMDAFTGGMPQIFNGSVPFLIFIATGNSQTGLFGQYGETQG
jgi:hypothetical protein